MIDPNDTYKNRYEKEPVVTRKTIPCKHPGKGWVEVTTYNDTLAGENVFVRVET